MEVLKPSIISSGVVGTNYPVQHVITYSLLSWHRKNGKPKLYKYSSRSQGQSVNCTVHERRLLRKSASNIIASQYLYCCYQMYLGYYIRQQELAASLVATASLYGIAHGFRGIRTPIIYLQGLKDSRIEG